ncbi:MAG: hypothetical protein OEL69_02235 [Nitrosopumilus sp.]|nr:hypothetical protein [Nitrosopumilus sp.]
MSYSTVNVKPEYLKKLDDICHKTKLSKTAILEILIDSEYEKMESKK